MIFKNKASLAILAAQKPGDRKERPSTTNLAVSIQSSVLCSWERIMGIVDFPSVFPG